MRHVAGGFVGVHMLVTPGIHIAWSGAGVPYPVAIGVRRDGATEVGEIEQGRFGGGVGTIFVAGYDDAAYLCCRAAYPGAKWYARQLVATKHENDMAEHRDVTEMPVRLPNSGK